MSLCCILGTPPLEKTRRAPSRPPRAASVAVALLDLASDGNGAVEHAFSLRDNQSIVSLFVLAVAEMVVELYLFVRGGEP